MLPTPGPPPEGTGWAAELKRDGMRTLVVADRSGLRVLRRSGLEVTAAYPELLVLCDRLGDHRAVLDGEIIAPGEDGRPDLGRLHARMQRTRPPLRLLTAAPTSFYVFDLLHLDGTDLLTTPYRQRRGLLDDLALPGDAVEVPTSHLDITPGELLEIACRNDHDGVVAKAQESHYRPGARTKNWIKSALRHTTDCVVGGWLSGRGPHRHLLDSLLLGVQAPDGTLRYAGQLSAGFSDHDRTVITDELLARAQFDNPFTGSVPPEFARRAHWVRPVVVIEVNYRECTDDGWLRHPSFERFRASL